MKQNSTCGSPTEKGGKPQAKVLVSTLLAVCLLVSMSIPAFALSLQGADGQGTSIEYSTDYLVHYANGKKLQAPKAGDTIPTETAKEFADGGFPGKFEGIIPIKVGETVKIHFSQNVWFWGEGATSPNSIVDDPANRPIAIKRIPGNKTKGELLESDFKRHDESFCWEFEFTGLKEGVEWWCYKSSPSNHSAVISGYYKIVVSSGDADSAAVSGNTSSSNSSSNTPSQSTNIRATSDTVYTVKPGDTLATIALNAYGDMGYWKELQSANAEYLAQTTDGLIFVGFNLYLPATIGNGIIPPAVAGSGETLYTVKSGDTYGSIAQEHFGDTGRYKEIFNRNSDRLKDAETLFEGQVIVIPAN